MKTFECLECRQCYGANTRGQLLTHYQGAYGRRCQGSGREVIPRTRHHDIVWMRAEQMEMVLDAYERTNSAQQLAMFTNLFRGFLADHGADWTHNEYNDDIMWMVIACTRAHLLSGDAEFLKVARTNFDFCYARAASTGRTSSAPSRPRASQWCLGNGSRQART